MTKKEIIELYLADLGNLVANSDAKRSRIIDLENELKMLNQNNIKQTSVEFLEEQLWMVNRPDLFDQAKQMEKDQMEDIYIGHNQYNDEYETFEQYYNETFKSE